jgi:hypothetical protein
VTPPGQMRTPTGSADVGDADFSPFSSRPRETNGSSRIDGEDFGEEVEWEDRLGEGSR